MHTSETDVFVVGAGAAGTMLSAELARCGVDARTIDRRYRSRNTEQTQ